MKIRNQCLFTALVTLLLTSVISQFSTAFAQGTAFTYQGQLQNNGALASGTFNLAFTLYTNNTGGTTVAGPVTNNGVGISNGLFTVIIDFGAGPWNGESNWLEIAIETNGAPGFTTLAPRQQLTPTPYAIFANTSSNLSGTVQATQISGTLLDIQLLHDAVTINPGPGLSGGGKVALGNSITVTNTGVLSVTGNADITAQTVAGAVTLGDTATNTDTPNTIVSRDSSGNFAAGSLTLATNLTLPAPPAADNIFAGSVQLMNADSNRDFFIGLGSGPNYMASFADTGVGYNALNESYGTENTAIGAWSLYSNANCSNNTAIGYRALYADITSGNYNTATGWEALTANQIGQYNTAVGEQALSSVSSGGENTAVGAGAGISIQLGFYNIDVGVGADGGTDESNTIRIGSTGFQNRTFIAGIFGKTSSGGVPVFIDSNGQLGTTTSSARFKRDIHSMQDASDVLYSLEPVAFKYKTDIDPRGIPQFGLVAEQVDKVDPDLVARDDQGRAYSVRYEAVNAMLLNEFLKEHKRVEEQNAEISALQAKAAKVDSLEKRLDNLEETIKSLTGPK